MSKNKGQRRRQPSRVPAVPVKDLASLYFDENLPLKAVADRTRLPRAQVRSKLLEAGYTLRTRTETLAIRYEKDKSKWLAMAQEVAQDHDGSCLSSEYVDAHSPMRWRCVEGHEWPASLMNVKNSGTWCPTCSGREKLTLDEMKAIAAKRGGRCLSDEYLNNSKDLLWECSKGHHWSATPANVKRGKWCPTCFGKIALTIEKMQGAAEKKKGKCLSTTYVNNQTNLRWECAKGHQWEAIPNSILRGSWCRTCAGLDKPALEELQLVAEGRGGKCLSDSYNNARTSMHWECAHGHQWSATWDRIRKGTWCRECATGIGERICRAYFSQLLVVPFPTSRPDWLRSAQGTKLELDGYNEDLAIAFEHQGRQHYEAVPVFGHDTKKLSHRQQLDARKRALCSERGITLVEVPGIPDILPLEEVRDYIRAELERHGRLVPDDWDSRTVDLKVAYVSTQTEVQIECLRKIAIEKRGRCISECYVNDNTKLEWECAKGHRWKAIPGSIKRGTWCKYCAPNAPKNIQDANKAAERHGGKCLSQAYVNSKEPLLWECAKGHQWEAPLPRVLKRMWCRRCKVRRKK